MAYSDKVVDHYNNPRNVGSFVKGTPGVGTGLGLPTSRRIVEAHGGTLDLLVSSEGRTVFRIVLPRKGSLRSMPPRGHFLGEFLSHEGLAARGKVRDGKEV